MPPDPLPTIVLPPDCERCDGWHPDNKCPAHTHRRALTDDELAEVAARREQYELDKWRATYGRLDRVNDYPLRLIDWRPIAAGIALVALAVAARRTVRHGR